MVVIKEFRNFSNEDEMFEMANVSQSRTGLPVNIWISYKMSNHGPRIKAQSNYSNNLTKYELFIVTIEGDPQVIGDTKKLKESDINQIIDFVKRNKDILLRYWYEQETDIVNIITNFK